MTQNGPDSLDAVEQFVRDKIAEIDAELASITEQQSALVTRRRELNAERDKATRMLPRPPRKRRRAAEQPTLTAVEETPATPVPPG